MEGMDGDLAHVVGFCNVFKFNKGHDYHSKSCLLYHSIIIANYKLRITNYAVQVRSFVINAYRLDSAPLLPPPQGEGDREAVEGVYLQWKDTPPVSCR